MLKHNLPKFLALAVPCLVASIADAGMTSNEVEPNNPISSAQHVTDASDVTFLADLGNGGADDVDYYVFYASAGNVLTIDVDETAIDTCIAIIGGAPSYDVLRLDDDDGEGPNPLDSRIDDFVAPVTGYYTVGVSNFGRCFENGWEPAVGDLQPGSYNLLISGASGSAIKQIAIEIKPGNDDVAPINLKSRGKIPVALLSGPDFRALNVDRESLTFGSTGDEDSLSRCDWTGTDVNGDGLVDLVCHFNTQAADFKATDAEATVRGRTMDGDQFEGTGFLKVVPAKAQY
jgi:hypothetical protein